MVQAQEKGSTDVRLHRQSGAHNRIRQPGATQATHAVTPDPEGPYCCARITRRTEAK
ncbi:hypothetical protein GCM10027404_09060 [Arthrobacter tumbae]